jgi:hypothetical protein
MVTQLYLKGLYPKVQKGARLLDQKCPNWHKKIKLDRLDMEWSESCVLGQVYGCYAVGLRNLNLHKKSWHNTYIRGQQHGFTITPWTTNTKICFQYLTSLWRQEIRSRRWAERAA